MAESIFTLHSTDTNNYSVQKTFSGVNPEASSAALVETAKGFNRLTDNTYVGTKRINKFNADTEDGGASKATPTLTLDDDWLGVGTDSLKWVQYGYNGDGILGIKATTADGSPLWTRFDPSDGNGIICISNADNTGLVAGTQVTITLCAPETDNYKSATISKTLTW